MIFGIFRGSDQGFVADGRRFQGKIGKRGGGGAGRFSGRGRQNWRGATDSF